MRFWETRKKQLDDIKNILSQPAVVEETVETLVSEMPVAKEKPKPKEKTELEIIQEIHDAYDNSCENLLNQAKAILEKASKVDTGKAERLSSLGFTSTAKVQESAKILAYKKKSEETAALIAKYAMSYPNNKFITRDQVTQINSKYKLVCVKANQYLGDIPEKNLEEIEAFQLKPEDRLFRITTQLDKWNNVHEFQTLTQLEQHIMMEDGWRQDDFNRNREERLNSMEEGLYISCPKKDAKIKTTEYYGSDGFVREVKDPIVLKPVIGGFLIVTKWGLEASDPIVVNQRDN